MSVATNGAEVRAIRNRHPGPCAACGAYVPRWSGSAVLPRPGARWIVYCAAHSTDASGPANDQPAAPPAGSDAPPCSEDAARAAIALLRHATSDKRAPEGAVDAATEIATLCVWRTGSPTLARELYAALPSKMIPEPADERAADIIGAILDGRGERMIDEDRAREESYAPVSNADAIAAADALVGPPVDSPSARAYAPQIPDGTPGPARLAARFPIHPAPAKPAPKRERASKGAGRWAHRKGGKG